MQVRRAVKRPFEFDRAVGNARRRAARFDRPFRAFPILRAGRPRAAPANAGMALGYLGSPPWGLIDGKFCQDLRNENAETRN